MKPEQAQHIANDIVSPTGASGPERVVIDSEGTAVNFKKACSQGVMPDIIFIRHDGWTLGAPKFFEKIAYEMWKEDWVYFIRRPSRDPRPISDYPG